MAAKSKSSKGKDKSLRFFTRNEKLRALALLDESGDFEAVAQKVGCHPTSLAQWKADRRRIANSIDYTTRDWAIVDFILADGKDGAQARASRHFKTAAGLTSLIYKKYKDGTMPKRETPEELELALRAGGKPYTIAAPGAPRAPQSKPGQGKWQTDEQLFTREQKLAILDRLERGERASTLAREFGIADSTISGWKNKRHRIERAAPGTVRQVTHDAARLERNRAIVRFVLADGKGGAQARAARHFDLDEAVISTVMIKYRKGGLTLDDDPGSTKTLLSRPEPPRSAPSSRATSTPPSAPLSGMDALIERMAERKLAAMEAELESRVQARLEQMMADKLGKL